MEQKEKSSRPSARVAAPARGDWGGSPHTTFWSEGSSPASSPSRSWRPAEGPGSPRVWDRSFQPGISGAARGPGYPGLRAKVPGGNTSEGALQAALATATAALKSPWACPAEHARDKLPRHRVSRPAPPAPGRRLTALDRERPPTAKQQP